MRVAALYDIHANLPALEAVLFEIQREHPDLVVIGGDVLPGPLPRETIALLLGLDLPARFIQGNGDRAVLEEMRGVDSGAMPESARGIVRWVAHQLGRQDEELIASWPRSASIEIAPLGLVLFCHASPRNDTEIFTAATPSEKLTVLFERTPERTVVCGHTHMQFDRAIGQTRVINAGSVGMPFGEPGAYWLMLDREPQLRHTRYDLNKAAERIRDSDYPQREDFAMQNILRPHSQAEMLAVFAKSELS